MKDSQISAVLAPVLASLGLELEALDVVPAGKRRVLRVVVDGDGPHGRGPLLDDIAEAAKAVSAALDASDATGAGAYTLEVTSRGVSRPLIRPQHWRRNAGRLVVARLVDGGSVTGRVLAADEETVTLDVDGTPRRLTHTEVQDGTVQVEFNRPGPATDLEESEED